MATSTKTLAAGQEQRHEPDAEELGRVHAQQIIDFVEAEGGHFKAAYDYRKRRWKCSIFVTDILVPLDLAPDNAELADLFMRVCKTTHLGPGSRHAIARLQAKAMEVERQAAAAERAAMGANN